MVDWAAGFCYRHSSVADGRFHSRLKAVRADLRSNRSVVQAQGSWVGSMGGWLRRRRVSGLLGVQAAFAVAVVPRDRRCVSPSRTTAGHGRNCTDS
jgi:hypothetical protein